MEQLAQLYKNISENAGEPRNPKFNRVQFETVKNNHFKLVSDFAPTGNQPQAIEALVARLHGEFNEFFPENAVEYLVKETKRDRLDDTMWIK